MNHLRSELERYAFSEEEKEQLKERLGTGMENRKKGRPRNIQRGIVALVAVCSLLVGAAGAVSLVHVSPQFRAFFGTETAEQAEQVAPRTIHQVYEDPNGTGVTLTVEEVLMDEQTLYVFLELAAPEGIGLPALPEQGQRADYWLPVEWGFYADEAHTQYADQWSAVSGGCRSLPDADPLDNCLPLVCTITRSGGTFTAEANYLRLTTGGNGDSVEDSLRGYNASEGGWTDEVLSGFHFDLTIPLEGSRIESHVFTGRSMVNLGGVCPVLLENLTLSPLSMTMDLILPDDEGYLAQLDAQREQETDWGIYARLWDGTRVAGHFDPNYSIQIYRDENSQEKNTLLAVHPTRVFWESPIDPLEVADLVFVGDNDPPEERADGGVGHMVYFRFEPDRFQNTAYWTAREERQGAVQEQKNGATAVSQVSSAP